MYKNFDSLVAEGERNFINAPEMSDSIENKINLSDQKENIEDV